VNGDEGDIYGPPQQPVMQDLLLIQKTFREILWVCDLKWGGFDLRTTLCVLSLFLLVTGCTQQSKPETKAKSAAEDPLCNPTPIRHFDLEQKAKSITEEVDGIDQAVAVQIDKELDVAIQVSNFNRLRLESIEKEVAQKLKTAFPQASIHVSSDKKIMAELQKLNETPWSTQQEEACKQKKNLKRIEKQMKG
jgi:hypothetical protein